MNTLFVLRKALHRLDHAIMPVNAWTWFVRALALAFLVYWIHLSTELNDWLGSGGYHPPSSSFFTPLPSPFPLILWWWTFTGGLLLLSHRTVALGCLMAGCGFFYATMTDPASVGALNMHFLFALAVIAWGTSLQQSSNPMMSAWPAYLLRLYLMIVYFGSGWRKAIYGDWLNDPNAMIHCLTGYYTTRLTCWLYSIAPSFTWTCLQYAALAFELGAPLLFLYPPLRRGGLICGCALHLGIAFLMKDLFYFSFQMIVFYISFLIPISNLNTTFSHECKPPTIQPPQEGGLKAGSTAAAGAIDLHG